MDIMLEMMDSCSMSESVETLSGDVSEPNETARGSNGPAFENVMDFTKKINSSTSSLTSPVDSGVVLLDEVEPSTDTKKVSSGCFLYFHLVCLILINLGCFMDRKSDN